MNSYFEYNNGTKELPANSFRISPSQVSKFFDSTSAWYRNAVFGEQEEIKNRTPIELGNCVHAAAHMYFDTGTVDHVAILNYINSITDPEVDKSIISAQYPIMLETLLANFDPQQATYAEMFIDKDLLPNIYVGGSIDLFDKARGILYDYKTTGSLDSARIPTSFPRAYYFQQLTYAYLLKEKGFNVNYVKLLYITRANVNRISPKTGKPMKDYPSEFHIVTEEVTQEKLDFIESCLMLIAESVQAFKNNLELQHIIAQDYRLKLPTKPILFKD